MSDDPKFYGVPVETRPEGHCGPGHRVQLGPVFTFPAPPEDQAPLPEYRPRKVGHSVARGPEFDLPRPLLAED
jgi:hypothetical protein